MLIYVANSKQDHYLLHIMTHLSSAVPGGTTSGYLHASSSLGLGKFLSLYFFVLYYKKNTFSVLIYSYINTRENWENSKFYENTPPSGFHITVYINTENVLYLLINLKTH
jgi:hypothetical protein